MIRRQLKGLLNGTAGVGAVGLLRAIRLMDRRRSADFAAAFLRKTGPLLKEHQIGRDNLRASFPEKTDTEIEEILGGVWDNLGRIAVEFAHLDEFHFVGSAPPTPDDITYTPDTYTNAQRILHSGKPVIAFAAHLANWELPALCTKLLGLKSGVLYRRPNIGAISDFIVNLRTPLMGELVPTGLDAPVRLGRLLEAGICVGMLVDQFFTRGVEVTFFGRTVRANPLAALLARQSECPIHGLRMVRLADKNSFAIDVTPPIKPVRDAGGRVDVQATTQRINSIIEGWVREHPEQWLWLHRRWRRPDGRGFEVKD
jgi:Kdo2-lipid IVA lauroyltransferase/acyltransferase